MILIDETEERSKSSTFTPKPEHEAELGVGLGPFLENKLDTIEQKRGSFEQMESPGDPKEELLLNYLQDLAAEYSSEMDDDTEDSFRRVRSAYTMNSFDRLSFSRQQFVWEDAQEGRYIPQSVVLSDDENELLTRVSQRVGMRVDGDQRQFELPEPEIKINSVVEIDMSGVEKILQDAPKDDETKIEYLHSSIQGVSEQEKMRLLLELGDREFEGVVALDKQIAEKTVEYLREIPPGVGEQREQ